MNLYSGIVHETSLRPDDVGAIVFRSKNYLPLLPYLDELDRRKYRMLFHFTITGLPRVFEPNVPDLPLLQQCARALSERYGSERMLWRCDPILISSTTSAEFYLARFREVAAGLEGLTTRCYFCFAIYYDKVERNLGKLYHASGIECYDPPRAEHIELAMALAEIADEYGIQMLSCCGDYLVGGKIGKAHCIDAGLLHGLFPDRIGALAPHPVRRECGCAECVDIGMYDTCPHGCVYCYANTSKEAAVRRYRNHQPDQDILVSNGDMAGRRSVSAPTSSQDERSNLAFPFWRSY